MKVKVSHTTRLMQDFQPVRPVDATGDLRALRVDDRPLVFSVGTDKVLHMIYQMDSDSGQGWTRRTLLGMDDDVEVTAFGVAQDPFKAGLFRISAAVQTSRGPVLYCSRPIDFDLVDWKDAAAVAALWRSLPLPDSESRVDEVRVDKSGKVLIATSSRDHPAAYLIFDYDRQTLQEYGLPEAGARIHQVVLGKAFGMDGIFLLYDVGTDDRTLLFTSFPHPRFNRTFKRRYNIKGAVNDFFVVSDGGAFDKLYTCGEAVSVFYDNSDMEVIAKDSDITFNQIRVVEEDGKTTVWLQGNSENSLDHGLYYVTNQYAVGDSVTTRWTSPLLMMSNVAVFACEKQQYISNHLFTVSSSNTLQHLYQDRATTLWRKQFITLEDTNAAEEISSYFMTANFSGLDREKRNVVKVSASSTVYASVNESNVIIGPRKSVFVDLGIDAEICVAIPVENISAPDVVLTADFIPGGSETIKTTEKALNDLAAYQSGQELRDAKDANGKPIFTDEEDAPSVESLEKVMFVTKELLEHAKTLSTSSSISSPSTSFADSDDEENEIGKRISIEQAGEDIAVTEEKIEKKERGVRSRSVFSGGGNSMGDFFSAVGDAIKDGFKWVIEKTASGLRFLIEIGGKFIDYAVKAYEEVVAFVAYLFERIKVAWEKLKRFISFLFNFDDIIKCKRIFKKLTNVGIDFVKNKMGGARDAMNDFADEAKASLGAEALNDNIRESFGGKTIRGETSKAEDDESSAEPAANSSEGKWMNRKVKQSTEQQSDKPFEGELIDLLDSVGKVFTDTVENVEFFAAELKDSIMKLFRGEMDIAEFMIKIFKTVAAVLIDTVQNVANVAFDVLQIGLTLVRGVLNFKLRIPVLSSLLEKMIPGSKFEASLLDVICFVGAVPATIVYKLATNRAPHQDISVRKIEKALGLSKSQRTEVSEHAERAGVSQRSFGLAKAPDNEEVQSARNTAFDSDDDDDNDGGNSARKVLAILGGVIGIIRSVTLVAKMARQATYENPYEQNVTGESDMISPPPILQAMDMCLGLILAVLGTAVVSMADERGKAEKLAIGIGSVTIFAVIWALVEIRCGNPTKGMAYSTFMLIILVMGTIRAFAHDLDDLVWVQASFGAVAALCAFAQPYLVQFREPKFLTLNAVAAGSTFLVASAITIRVGKDL